MLSGTKGEKEIGVVLNELFSGFSVIFFCLGIRLAAGGLV
jgi:hypothetical protein